MSCDPSTDWVEGDMPKGFTRRGLRVDTMFNLTPMAHSALFGATKKRITIPWWVLLIIGGVAGGVIF